MEFYCPSCGEWSIMDYDVVEPINIAPGEIEIICKHRGTIWCVKIEFEEVKEA